MTAMCSFFVSMTNTARRELLEVLDAAEVALELGEVAPDLQAFLLRHQVDLTGVDLTLELAQLRDT